MEAHIKGHANEIPDEDGTDSNVSSYTAGDIESPQKIDMESSTSTSANSSTIGSVQLIKSQPETPRESSSEATSDGDDLSYYGMYPRFEQTVANTYATSVPGGVNPALLAAVSIADQLRTASQSTQNQMHSPVRSVSPPQRLQQQQRSRSPPQLHQQQLPLHPPPPPLKQQHLLIQQQQQQQQLQHQQQQPHLMHQEPMIQDGYAYEPLVAMRQHGFFAPVPKVEEFR